MVVQTCPICVIVRPSDAFCDKKFCDPIDRRYDLPMFKDHGHIQVLGRRHYKPFIDKAISEALSIINQNSNLDFN